MTNIVAAGGAGQAAPEAQVLPGQDDDPDDDGDEEEPEEPGGGDVEAGAQPRPLARPKLNALAKYKRFSVLDLPHVRRRRRLMWAVRFGLLCLIPAWGSLVLVYAHSFSSLSYVGGLAIIVLLANVSDYVEIANKTV